MEKRVKDIVFFGSTYEYNLFRQGISTPVGYSLRKVENSPLDEECDLLVTGHMLPEFDSKVITSSRITGKGPENILVIAHGSYPMEGAPYPEDPHSGSYHFQWISDTAMAKWLVQMVEDQQNAHYSYSELHKRIVLLVEDEISFASYIIPLIMEELETRTLSLLPEEQKNTGDKTYSERPILLVAANYEQAVKYLEKYSDRMVGVISSLGFPKDQKNNLDSGFDLIRKVKSLPFGIPVVILSSQENKRKPVMEIGGAFLHKHSPDLLKSLRKEMLDYFGFGDFIFRMPADSRSEVARARNLVELRNCLEWIPIESFTFHAEKRHFSNWLGVHGYLKEAEIIRPISPSEGEKARKELISLLEKL
ncbi:MAG: hypothetical protein JXR95_07455 [Deltaproteobacteria bacterium]|nr:hypothetical protein [Deltaproteobacteria bacterium]